MQSSPVTPPEQPGKALVIKLGHIGDVLVTTPVMTALKSAWPGIEITMVVNQGTEAMVENNPEIDRVLVLKRDHKNKLSELFFQLGLIRTLRSSRFDVCLELSGGDRGAFLSRISRARFRVGFAAKDNHVRSKAFHVLKDRMNSKVHVVETFLDQVRALGIEPGAPPLVFHPDMTSQVKVEAILINNGLFPGNYVVVHPTSRWMFKCWTPQKMAAAVEHLAAKGYRVALSAAPVKAEMEFIDQMLPQIDPNWPVINLCGQLDLKTLGALIQHAALFLGVDSAPAHMAAALQTPVVVLFGPSGELMWGPWQALHEVVALDMDCRPCGRDGCNGTKISRCLTELPEQMVFDAIDRIMEA